MYVFYMEVIYEDTVAVSGSLFEVKKERRVEMPATLENKLIAFQVWQEFKEYYGGLFLFLAIILILLLVVMIVYHFWMLNKIPLHHKKKLKEIHIQLKKEAKKEQNKAVKKENLKKKLKMIEHAYQSKHISKEAYENSKNVIENNLKKI